MRPSYGDFILEQEKKEHRKRRLVIVLIAVMLFLLVAGVGVTLFFKKDSFSISFSVKGLFSKEELMGTAEDSEQEITYTQEELDVFVNQLVENTRTDVRTETLEEIKQYLAEGKSAVEMFRAVYTDDLVVAADGRYHFVPIRDDLKHNNYGTEHLRVLESGEFQYVEDGSITSYKGIDVSKFQGKIDWNKVVADGVAFTFIRVGNRGYSNGTLVEDVNFEYNIKGANAAGIKTGVYFFSQAITEEEAIEEVNFVLERIAPYQVDCPVVLDLEMIAGAEGRADSLTPEERTRIMQTFCDAVAEAGYKPMIYMNLEMAAIRVNLEELEAYDKWFAYYNPDFYFPYEYKVWQYSEKGTVAGVPEKVDMNICFAPIWE